MVTAVAVGNWIRPWAGELLVGEVLAVSGDQVLCRASGGVRFSVRLRDVVSGLVQVQRGRRWANHPWIRLTPKAMVS